MEFNLKWIVCTALLVCSFQYPCYGYMNSYDDTYIQKVIREFNNIQNASITEAEAFYQDDIIKYFREICDRFAEGTRLQNPNPSIVQFAAMTLNKASKYSSSTNRFDPYPIAFNLRRQLHNYDSAPPLKQGSTIIHAEERVLDKRYVRLMLSWFKSNRQQSQPLPPSIYLLTYLSPCAKCLNIIAELKIKYKITRVYVAWHLTYDGMRQKTFLRGLEKFYKNDVIVVYSFKGLCFDPKSRESVPLMQPTLYKVLYKAYKRKFCKSDNELSESLAKLVNYLVWGCKNVLDIDGGSKTEKNVEYCFEDEINRLNPKVDPKMKLTREVRDAVYDIWKTNRKLLLSPPLSPSDPYAISNNLDNLRGVISEPLCFQ